MNKGIHLAVLIHIIEKSFDSIISFLTNSNQKETVEREQQQKLAEPLSLTLLFKKHIG